MTDCIVLMQILCQRGYCEEGFRVEQEYRSFDRRHFLEYAIQDGNAGREGWTGYACSTNYYYYTNYVSLIILINLVFF